MENQFGKTNNYTRTQSHDARPGPTVPTDSFGLEPRYVEGDALNLLLTNKLLSALPAEEFSRLFLSLEPVSLTADQMLYKLDEEIRYAYFPETAVVSHL